MNPILVKALQLLLSLSILIVLHELGHFIPAKLFKTRVEKFYLFFDVKFSLFKKKIGDTVYGIGWLPLGGYVKIAGMIDESMDKEQMRQPAKPWEFRSKPAWQRLIIMIGGVTVNLILGFFIYMMVLFVWGTDYVKAPDTPHGFEVAPALQVYGFKNGDNIVAVNGKELDNALDINKHLLVRDVTSVTVSRASGQRKTIQLPDSIGSYIFKKGAMGAFSLRRKPVIDTVITDKGAFKAGLLKGDRIVSVNNKAITYWDELKTNMQGLSKIPLTIVRDGQQKQFMVTPDASGIIGVSSFTPMPFTKQHKTYSFSESVSKGFSHTYWTLTDYAAQFKYVFTKKGASQMGGFAAIGNMFAPTWDWQVFWERTALISIILAFMNILPIPALDGGHVMFLLYEIITGRKPNEKFLEYAQMVGFFILIGLVLFANGNDIYRAVTGK